VIHRSEEEIVTHGGIEEHLEPEGVPGLLKDKVTLASAVLGEEEVLIDPVHSEQCYNEAAETNNIVYQNVQHDDTRWGKGVEGFDATCVKHSGNRSNGEDDDVGATSGVGEQIRREKDLVVRWNVAGNEGLEERCEDTVPKHFLEGVEDEFMCTKGELAMTTRFFIKSASDTLLKFTTRIGNVPAVVPDVVQVNHELKIL
jgi:hypothetical protein